MEIASYVLSAYSFLFTEPLSLLIDVGHQALNGNPIPSFDEKLLIDLSHEAQKIFEKETNILELRGDFIVVGDIHGSLHDLLRILKFIQENQSKVLFLGDYIDRGNFSLECITLLYAMKVLYPNSIYLIRGNHEFDSICRQYGFLDEILDYHNPRKQTVISSNQKLKKTAASSSQKFKAFPNEPDEIDKYEVNYKDMNCYKYTESLYVAFVSSFSYLPVAAILNDTTFCIHGGLTPKLENLECLNTLINRPVYNFEDSDLLTEIVWGDPSQSANRLYDLNPRGNGFLFNKKAVADFLSVNSFKRMIRAHQYAVNGYIKNFDDQCITIFSASCYDKMHNSSAVLQLFQKDDTIDITTFVPLRRLEKKDAVYYRVEPFNPKGEKLHICFSFLHPNLMPIKNVRKISMQSSEGNISLQKSRKLSRPKFVTNQRSSYQFLKKPILLDQNTNDDYKSDGVNNNGDIII